MMQTKIEKYFYHGNQSIPYTIVFKKIKNIILKINKNNRIVISAPFYTSEKFINEFIYSNIERIMKMKDKKDNGTKFNIKNNVITLFGKKIRINITRILSGNNKYKLYDNELNLYIKSSDDKEKVVKRFLKLEAEKYLRTRVEEISKTTNLKYRSLDIRWFERKWGHCDGSNNIVLSSRVIVNEKWLIDYIIIHELCHTVHHNHSKDFWNLVEEFYPLYKDAKKELKEL